MFGNYGFGGLSFKNMNFTSEAIDKKLSEPETPLEDLLIEDELLQELRSQNKKLLDYLDKNKIKQMIDYITIEPSEDDQLKGHKFPFVCSQLFNVEETKIMNYFLKTNKELESINNAEMTNKDINSSKDMADLYKAKNDSNDKNNNNDDNEDEDDYGQEKINLFNKIDNLKRDEEDDVVVSESKKENTDAKLQENEDNENKKEENNNDEHKNENKKEEDKKNENKNDIKDNEEKKEEGNKNENNDNVNMINLNKDEQNENVRYNNGEKKKIENKKEVAYPEKGIEMLDYLLNFLTSEKDLNYVLCGYFESLINNILNINSKQFITYIYTQKKDILKNFVYHSYRKSIAEILSKILQFEKYFKEDTYNFGDEENNNKDINLNNEELKEMESIRKNILELIFEKIDINMDTEKLYCFSYLINELIETKEIFDEIISNKKIIDNLIIKQFTNLNLTNSEINQKRNFVIITDIIISWLKKIEDNNKPLIISRESNDEDLVELKNAQPQIKHTIISQALYEILPNLITVNFNKQNGNENKENDNILESYNNYSLKPLGIYRTKIIELIGSMLHYCKNISQSFDILLINSNLFESAFYYLFQYEWNNLYQESLLTLFKKFLTDSLSHELLADYLFIKLDIINIISSHFSVNEEKKENKFNFITTGNSINHGYEAFLVSLSYKINSVVGGDPLKIVGRSREGSISFMNSKNNNDNVNSAMNALYSGSELFDELMAAEDSNQKKSINEKEIGFMKKYLTEKWKSFFSENVVDKIKLYEKKLCEEERKKSDLFDQFETDENKENTDFEDLLGLNKKHKSRDDDFFGEADDDDEKDNEDDWGKERKSSNENKYNDEVDINEFDFVNEGSNDENENNSQKMVVDELDNGQENSNYNDANYWKNNVENNEYINKIGEEALKDLL